MSCAKRAEATQDGAQQAAGAPRAAALAGVRNCPQCGSFLAKSGECRNPKHQARADGSEPAADDGLDGYICARRQGPIPATLDRSWAKIVKNGWQNLADGADRFMARFGRGIKSHTLIWLARKAEDERCFELARQFWVRARACELGSAPPTLAQAGATARFIEAGKAIYDRGRMIGRQYRKRTGDDGTPLAAHYSVAGRQYRVGETSDDPDDWATARRQGVAPAPKHGQLRVGKFFEQAAGLLAEGTTHRRPDGTVELYDREGAILSAYDPVAEAAADRQGSARGSAEQLAAVMAYYAYYLPFSSACGEALRQDIEALKMGAGSALRAADGFYVLLQHGEGVVPPIAMGGRLKAVQCPNCGRWVGQLGCQNCPGRQGAGDRASGAGTAGVQARPPAGAAPARSPDNDQAGTSGAKGGSKKPRGSVQPSQADPPADKAPAEAAGRSSDDDQAGSPSTEAPARTVTRCASCRRIISKDGQRGHKPDCPVIAGDAPGASAQPDASARSEAPSTAAPKPAPSADSPPAAARPAAPPPAHPDLPVIGREPTPPTRQTDQEKILDQVVLPALDPYRRAVPARLGGQLATPIDLDAFIPPVLDDFDISADTEKALRTISTALQTGDPEMQSFYLAGKPGSGKNTILRQAAASVKTRDAQGNLRQGVPYYEVDISEDTNVEDLIGGTVIRDGNTYWNPGPLAAALMHGAGVVVLNEIVRRPKAATLLQSIMENREIQVKTPDGGLVRIPVGAGVIVAMTGNPGSDRDPDRPGAAAFTRTIPIKVEYGSKPERMRRAEARYRRRVGGPAGGQAARAKNALRHAYKIRTDPLQAQELQAAVDFVDELGQMIESRQVQARTGGGRPVDPGPRGLDRFIAIGKGSGDWRQGLEMFKCYCSQDPELFEQEWSLVQELFNRKFSLDSAGAWR